MNARHQAGTPSTLEFSSSLHFPSQSWLGAAVVSVGAHAARRRGGASAEFPATTSYPVWRLQTEAHKYLAKWCR